MEVIYLVVQCLPENGSAKSENTHRALESEVRLLKGSRLAEPIADPFFGAPASKDSASYPAYDYGKSAPESFQNLATANPREAKKPPMSLEKYKYIAAIHRMSEPEYRAAYLGEDEQKYVIDVMIQEQTARPPSQATVVAARKVSHNSVFFALRVATRAWMSSIAQGSIEPCNYSSFYHGMDFACLEELEASSSAHLVSFSVFSATS